MAWVQQDQYWAKNDNGWTLAISGKKELDSVRFQLFKDGIHQGVFKTQKEAVMKHKELTK